MASLLNVTARPVVYPPETYGGDDRDAVRQGFFGKLVAWERDPSGSCCPAAVKAWTLFLIEKAFVVLDWTGIGHLLVEGGLKGSLQKYRFAQGAEALNRLFRENVIEALGGREACGAIPVVSLGPGDLKRHLKIRDHYFPRGEWRIQGEDPAGRKFLAFRLKERASDVVYIATIHQASRETALGFTGHGAVWEMNFSYENSELRTRTLNEVLMMVCSLRDHGTLAHFRANEEQQRSGRWVFDPSRRERALVR